MILEGLSGQVSLVLLQWNFSVAFKRLKFIIWFWVFCIQMCYQAKHAKIFDEVEKILVHYICYWYLYCTCEPGLGSKIISWNFHKMWPFCTCLECFVTCDSFEASCNICRHFLTQLMESFSGSPNIFICYAWWHISILYEKMQLELASRTSSNQQEAYGPVFICKNLVSRHPQAYPNDLWCASVDGSKMCKNIWPTACSFGEHPCKRKQVPNPARWWHFNGSYVHCRRGPNICPFKTCPSNLPGRYLKEREVWAPLKRPFFNWHRQNIIRGHFEL